jgi:hypothetical protein
MWITIHIALNNIHQSLQTSWNLGEIQIIFNSTVTASIQTPDISREVSMTLQFRQEARDHRHRLQEERILNIRVDYLARNRVEESREPYLSKPGPEAWQEPPAPPSTSSSWSVGSTSPSPGSFKGMERGKDRSAAAPVVMGTIGPYHAHHLPDCRTSHCDESLILKEDDAKRSEGNLSRPITEQYQD